MKKLISILDFLPSEFVKASELRRGDVAYIHSSWGMVTDTRSKNTNTIAPEQWTWEIDDFSGSVKYLPPNHTVKIVKRDLFDEPGLQAFIAEHLEEQRRFRILEEEEEREERERTREYLKERLRDLGDE